MNAEDLTKMQNLISDNKSLKGWLTFWLCNVLSIIRSVWFAGNLEKSNQVLRRHFSMIQQYQSEVQTKQEEIQTLNNKVSPRF
jgi:hypothetical protein